MGRTVDWNDIPESAPVLPEGLYDVEIDDITEGASKAGKLMYTATLRVADHKQRGLVGSPIFERFNIGSDDDPNGDDPQTWRNSIGAKRLKQMFAAAQVPLVTNIDQMIAAARKQRLTVALGIEVDDGVRDARYKGVQRNRIMRMYPRGEHIPGPAPAQGPASPAPAPASAAAPPARAARTTTAAKVATAKCPMCEAIVPRAEYAKHVSEAHADEEEE